MEIPLKNGILLKILQMKRDLRDCLLMVAGVPYCHYRNAEFIHEMNLIFT